MIIIKRENNEISVMHLVDGADVDDAIEKFKAVHKDYIRHEEYYGELPDREFRDAWSHDVDVDMPRARKLHMNKIRKARDLKLEELDIETLKGNNVQIEKQKLRDIPKKFKLTKAETPEALSLLWPDGL